MDIAQLIQTLVATVVGGLIVIATNWISARGKRRQDIQEWYEQTYITEGLDPLIAYYQNLAFCLVDKWTGNQMNIIQKEVPVESLGNVRVLLKTVSPLNIILNAHTFLTHSFKGEATLVASQIIQNAVEDLLAFRLELTQLVSNQVRDKHYIPDTSNVVANLYKTEQELQSLLKEQNIRILAGDKELAKYKRGLTSPGKA